MKETLHKFYMLVHKKSNNIQTTNLSKQITHYLPKNSNCINKSNWTMVVCVEGWISQIDPSILIKISLYMTWTNVWNCSKIYLHRVSSSLEKHELCWNFLTSGIILVLCLNFATQGEFFPRWFKVKILATKISQYKDNFDNGARKA